MAIQKAITLPCGVTLRVPTAKSALSENLALDGKDDRNCFREWTTRTRRHGAAFWAQLNHPGRLISDKAD